MKCNKKFCFSTRKRAKLFIKRISNNPKYPKFTGVHYCEEHQQFHVTTANSNDKKAIREKGDSGRRIRKFRKRRGIHSYQDFMDESKKQTIIERYEGHGYKFKQAINLKSGKTLILFDGKF